MGMKMDQHDCAAEKGMIDHIDIDHCHPIECVLFFWHPHKCDSKGRGL